MAISIGDKYVITDTSAAWFYEGLNMADEIRFITEGRLSFVSAETGEQGTSGNSKGSVLFIWRPLEREVCKITHIRKKELLPLTTGCST